MFCLWNSVYVNQYWLPSASLHLLSSAKTNFCNKHSTLLARLLCPLTPVYETFTSRTRTGGLKITKEPAHPDSHLFQELPSGWWYQTISQQDIMSLQQLLSMCFQPYHLRQIIMSSTSSPFLPTLQGALETWRCLRGSFDNYVFFTSWVPESVFFSNRETLCSKVLHCIITIIFTFTEFRGCPSPVVLIALIKIILMLVQISHGLWTLSC